MNYACLKNLSFAVAFLCVISLQPVSADEHGAKTNKMQERSEMQTVMPRGHGSAPTAGMATGAQAQAQSMIVRNGIGVAMVLSAPLEVSCDRIPALGQVGQGQPAQGPSSTRGQPEASGTARTATATGTVVTDQAAVSSHGRMPAVKIAQGKVTISCDEVDRYGETQHSQQSGARQSSRFQ